jgi:hypothetical protein
VGAQLREARETVFAGDGRLRIVQRERTRRDLFVAGSGERREGVPNSFEGAAISEAVRFEEIFRLGLQVFEIGTIR